jgi:hypothetical protein
MGIPMRRFVSPARGLALLLTSLAMFPRALCADPYDHQKNYLGENHLDQFGFAVAPAGDVNGDGFADFLVGANANDEEASAGGKAYLYLGGDDYPSTAALTFAGALELGYVGGALAGGHDLNSDGFDDWVVGAPGSGPTGDLPGRAYVCLGAATPDFVPDLILEGDAPGGQFGAAVIIVSDLDGDGFGDLAVGAPRDGEGAVFLYRGGSLDGVPDQILRARPLDQRFGKALASLPDDDGNGCDELLVGAPRSSETSTWAGAVVLYRGTADLDLSPDLTMGGESAGDEFGSCLGVGEDVDGDGEPDLLIGAPAANAAGNVDAGKAYLFRAGGAWNPGQDLLLRGSAPGERFGTSVALGFDWDGDGAGDLAVGAPGADTNGPESGAFRVYRGGEALDSAADVVLSGPISGMHLGRSLAFLGDVRHNGRGCVMASGYNNNPGRGFLYGVDSAPTHVEALSATEHGLSVRPNPFRRATEILFSLPDAASTRLSIHDVNGRLVRSFAPPRGPGEHRIVWDGCTDHGRGVASGVYFVRLEIEGRSSSAKLLRLRQH